MEGIVRDSKLAAEIGNVPAVGSMLFGLAATVVLNSRFFASEVESVNCDRL